jgi:hypothetical protein
MIAKYLAEHGHRFVEEWLQPYLLIPWADFWSRSSSIFRISDGLGDPLLKRFGPSFVGA